MTRILKWFYAAMLWATAYELHIAQATSSNFKYLGKLKADLRYWQGEQRKFEMQRGFK